MKSAGRGGLQMMTIGILHPGRMGAAVAAEAVKAGARVLWCPEGRSADARWQRNGQALR